MPITPRSFEEAQKSSPNFYDFEKLNRHFETKTQKRHSKKKPKLDVQMHFRGLCESERKERLEVVSRKSWPRTTPSSYSPRPHERRNHRKE